MIPNNTEAFITYLQMCSLTKEEGSVCIFFLFDENVIYWITILLTTYTHEVQQTYIYALAKKVKVFIVLHGCTVPVSSQ